MKKKHFAGYHLSDIDHAGADAFFDQDLNLTIPGDGSTVIYTREAVMEEICRHDMDEYPALGVLLRALNKLKPETLIFI